MQWDVQENKKQAVPGEWGLTVSRRGFEGFRGIICTSSQCDVAAKWTETEEQMGNLCHSQTQAVGLNRRSWLHLIILCETKKQMRFSNSVSF